MKKTNKQQTAQVQQTSNVNTLVFPNEPVTLANLVKCITEQATSLTAVKQARPVINAYLQQHANTYGYKEVLGACRAHFKDILDNRAGRALAGLTYDNVLSAVAPLVMNTPAFKDIATDALKVGAYKVGNPVEFCRAYYTAVSDNGELLVTQSYITDDRKHIASRYVVRELSHKIATAVLEQSFRNFDRVARMAYGMGKKLDNIRIVGALSGDVYNAVVIDGKYTRGEKVKNSGLRSSAFKTTVAEANKELQEAE